MSTSDFHKEFLALELGKFEIGRGSSDDMTDAMKYLFSSLGSGDEREYRLDMLKANVKKAERDLAHAKQQLADFQFRGTGRTTSLIRDVDVPQTLFLVWHRQDISYAANIAQNFLSEELFQSLAIMSVDNLPHMDLAHRLQSWRGPIIVDHLVWERLHPYARSEVKIWQSYANRGRF